MMKRILASALTLAICAATALASPSILDIKHTITDDNLVAPESFETKTIELEQDFYLRNFSADPSQSGSPVLATPEVYERRLSQLPTEIEMPYNDLVRKFIEMYISKRSKLVGDMLALHSYYGPVFVEELEKAGMPLELQYLPVIESAINPNAVSRAGAAGLWQFMPGTAKGLGMEVNTLVDQRRDPRESSRMAARYLKQLYDIYGDWSLAIAAYNCGPGNVNKAIRRAGGGNGVKKDFWEIYNYLPSETRGYIPAFIAANYVMNYYRDHNIAPRVVKQPLVTDTVTVNNRVHFNQISGVLNIPVEEIRMLNPQFRKDIIPGNNHPYTLTLPSAQILSYVMSEQEILDFDHDLYAQRTYVEPGNNSAPAEGQPDAGGTQPRGEQTQNADSNQEVAQADLSTPTRIQHTVAHGESLRDVARRYNVSATDIKRWNNLRRAKIKEGDVLVIETFDNANLMAQTPDTRRSQATSDVPAPAPKQKAEQPAVPQRQASEPKTSASQAAVPQRRQGSQASQSTSTPAPTASTGSSRKSSTSEAAESTTSQKQRRKEGSGSTASTTSSSSSKKSSSSASSSSSSSSSRKQSSTSSKKKQQPATKTVTAKKGDSLEKLARANGTTVDAIKKANNLKGDMIQEGQNLKMPAASKSASGKKGASASKSKSSSSSKSKSGSSSRRRR